MDFIKTGPATVIAGSNLPDALTLTNNGPDPAASPSLTDTLPSAETFVSFTQSSGTSASVSGASTSTAPWATLAAGSAASFVLVGQVTPTASGTLSNTATVSSITSDP